MQQQKLFICICTDLNQTTGVSIMIWKRIFPYTSKLLLSIKSTLASAFIPTSASVLDSQTIDWYKTGDVMSSQLQKSSFFGWNFGPCVADQDSREKRNWTLWSTNHSKWGEPAGEWWTHIPPSFCLVVFLASSHIFVNCAPARFRKEAEFEIELAQITQKCIVQ